MIRTQSLREETSANLDQLQAKALKVHGSAGCGGLSGSRLVGAWVLRQSSSVHVGTRELLWSAGPHVNRLMTLSLSHSLAPCNLI